VNDKNKLSACLLKAAGGKRRSEIMRRILQFIGLGQIVTILSACQMAAPGGSAQVRTIDHMVPHVSTVPANKGEQVQIFVREKVLASDGVRPAVLMVHGATSPSTLAFDVAHGSYSWMAYLARAGFDVFAVDMTGYGKSARPKMDDPCNVDPARQNTLIPKTVSAPCKPSYAFQLVNNQSESDEIDRVVEYIRKLRGVAKVNLIGWSLGGYRIGTYANRYPEKIDRLVFYASARYSRKGASNPPSVLPQSGFPINIQSREVAEVGRWNPSVKCDGQIEPGMQDVIWELSKQADPVGMTWGPGVLRAPTLTSWGWNTEAAKKIKVPALVIVGEFDELTPPNKDLYEDLGSANKVFAGVSCASHFMLWETQHRPLHEASREWLTKGTFNGASHGMFQIDREGRTVVK
jgi:pimeloyl-ACP methyl ester carboxylesterase